MSAATISAIRHAFMADEFTRALRLWEEYAAELRTSVEAGTASEASMAEARELLEWSRLAVRSFQSHAAARLGEVRAARAYSGAPEQEPVCLRGML